MLKFPYAIAVVDIGNSRIKWAFYDRFCTPGEAQYSVAADIDDVAALLACGTRWSTIETLVLCCVAGDAMARKVAQLLRPLLLPSARIVRFRAMPSACGVRNGYEVPSQLGADRFAALVAAWHRLHSACLVVCAGTATTIDVLEIDAKGAVFRGGLILPGMELMITSLAGSTANLPIASGGWQAFPGNTDDAIISGCINAQAGAIARQYRLLPPGTPCLITGGAAEYLMPHLDLPAQFIDSLVLEGLCVFARTVCTSVILPVSRSDPAQPLWLTGDGPDYQ